MQPKVADAALLRLLTPDMYYTAESDKAWMSPSLYKSITTCEARAMAKLAGDYEYPDMPALTIGQVVESIVLNEDPDKVISAHPEMYTTKLAETPDTIQIVASAYPELVTRNMTWRQGALTKARELMPEAFDKQSYLKADYDIIQQCVDRLRSDKMLMEYLQGDHQTVLTGEIGGMRWKGKTDVIDIEHHRIVDLKVMRDFSRRGGLSFVEAMRYDEQLADYVELARQTYGGDWEAYIVAVSKETPSDICLARIPAWRIAECLQSVEAGSPSVRAVWTGARAPHECGRCDYCREHKHITEPIDSDLVGMCRRELLDIGAID